MTRVVLATGRPRLNAAIAAAPDIEVVADAYYADAAATALAELRPDVAVVDRALPGAGSADWAGLVGSTGARVVWLGGPSTGPEASGSDAGGVVLAADVDAAAVIGAIRSDVPGREAFTGCATPCTGVYAFVGCLPRVGVSTAAVAFAVSAARAGARVAVVDANFAHPNVSGILGWPCPRSGWESAKSAAELREMAIRVHGVDCLPLVWEAGCDPAAGDALERLTWVASCLRNGGWSLVVVDLGSPRPIHHGRLAPWLPWLMRVGASAQLLIAQDPPALLAAARILRTADGVGADVQLWCASFDQRVSTLAELTAALGRPCKILPWDRTSVVRRALAGKPPGLSIPLASVPPQPG
jgi:hypothetical protein